MKKLIAIMLSALMVLSLAACSSSSTAATEAAPAATEAAAEAKVLVTGTNVAFPPYEFYENEEGVGIDIDILKAIADKIGYEFELQDMEFGSIISAAASGKIDVGFGAITVTEERKKSVHFTDSYATGIQKVIVTNDSPIASIDDLYGDDVKIGVQQDTTGDIYATGDFGEEHIARFSKGADAVQALKTGKVTAVIIDDSPAATFVSQNDGLKLLETAYAEEEYAFLLSYDNPLYDTVNNALNELIKDGTVQSIIDKYIKAD